MNALMYYRIRDNLRGVWITLVVVVIVIAAFFAGVVFLDGEGVSISFSGFSFAVVIYALVAGIVGGRVDLRLGNQMGMSRRSSFWNGLAGKAVSFAVVAVIVTVVTLLIQLAVGPDGPITYIELYQMMYSDSVTYVMPALDYVMMTLLDFACYLCAGAFGLLCTMAFWRANLIVKWVLGIGMGAVFCFGAPVLSAYLPPAFLRFGRILFTNVMAMIGFLLVWAAVFTLGAWLLARKAPILAPKG